MGWNGSNSNNWPYPKDISRRNVKNIRGVSKLSLFFIFLLSLVILFIILDFFFVEKETISYESRVVKKSTDKKRVVSNKAHTEKVKSQPIKEKNKNKTASIISGLSKAEKENLYFSELAKKKIDLSPRTNRIFRSGLEASIARIFMTVPGDPPPPPFTTVIPLRDEAHLEQILTSANPILESDTEQQKESKKMVELAKKELIKFINEGGNPEDFLNHYHSILRESFDLRRESAKSFMKVAREEPEIAQQYLNELNKNLSERGIKEIQLSDKQKERLGLQ